MNLSSYISVGRLILLTSWLLSACREPKSIEQGSLSNDTVKINPHQTDLTQQSIINGNIVIDNNEGVVFIAYDTPSYQGLACTGVLLNNSWVLTAAHCVWGKTASDVKVYYRRDTPVSFLDKHPQVQIRTATELISHPSYVHLGYCDLLDPKPDLGLIHLSSPLIVANKTHGFKTAVYSGTKSLLLGKSLRALGYGAVYPETDPVKIHASLKDPTYLREANLSINNILLPSLIGYKKNLAGQIIYHGDSGGPSFLAGSNELVGIHACSYEDLHAGYDTDHVKIRDWVFPIVNTEMDEVSTQMPHTDDVDILNNQEIAVFSDKNGYSESQYSAFINGQDGSFSVAEVKATGTYDVWEGIRRPRFKVIVNHHYFDYTKCFGKISGESFCKVDITILHSAPLMSTRYINMKSYVLSSRL